MGGRLIAVVTCRARRAQADAQRRTWAAGRSDVRFFVGASESSDASRDEEFVLDVDDGYDGLPAKVRAVCRWALEAGYDSLLKVDDDVYLVPERLPDYVRYDYVGNFRARNGNYRYDYASGFAYHLSRRAMEIVAQAELTEDSMEDRWVGQVLGAARPPVSTYDEKRFACTFPCGVDEARALWGSPIGRSHMAYAQYPAEKFDGLRYWFGRTFHRDGI